MIAGRRLEPFSLQYADDLAVRARQIIMLRSRLAARRGGGAMLLPLLLAPQMLNFLHHRDR